ncbi:MAG TPA: MucR family transcriptional regulator [Allosphingosinicella sp.]|nr:MucR family transcriptional regulator [Allosphingosinicella sp.]
MEQETLLALTADIVAAHVANNTVSVGDLPELVKRVHGALAGLGQSEPEPAQEKVPVVSVRASIKPDYLVCMECGRRQKTLKRHLQTAHGMTPAQYRADYGLPSSYPMVAPEYSKRRSEMANAIGLGRKRGKSRAAPKAAAARGGNNGNGNGDGRKAAAKPGRRRKAAPKASE